MALGGLGQGPHHEEGAASQLDGDVSSVSLADLFSCFNGGECVHPAFCDCRRFNATGPRCQMGESGLHSTSRLGRGYSKICGPDFAGGVWLKGIGGGPASLEPTSLWFGTHGCYTETFFFPWLSV